MLERAGLVECYQAQGRRKYFRIARKTVLEIAVSPHSYGVRAYLSEDAPKVEDIGPEDAGPAQNMKLLRDELTLLEEKRRELRVLLSEIESREMEIKQIASVAAEAYAEDLLESEILSALLCGNSIASDLAMRLEVPEIIVVDRLQKLEERGALHLIDQEWCL
jgi:ArsR family transcriptional regulator